LEVFKNDELPLYLEKHGEA